MHPDDRSGNLPTTSTPRVDDYLRGRPGVAFSGLANLARQLERELAEAKSARPEAREKVIRECWEAIDAKIQRGDLGGNGCDKNAQRNGMVLASNILAEMMGWPKAKYAEDIK